jgi:methylglutaconyl-CoA hydratase
VREVLAAGPEAVRAAKQLIRDVWALTGEHVKSLTAETIAGRRVSDEGREGIRAFLEKRTPGWAVEK